MWWKMARVMLGLERPLKIGPYVVYGVALMAAKVAIDTLLLREAHRSPSWQFYLSPAGSDLRTPSGEIDPAMLGLLAAAIPFMVVGVWLTLRRLLDAGLPRWLAVLFFAPFAKFVFFVVCATVPSRDPARLVAVPAGPYRESRFVVEPARRPGTAFLVGSLAGTVVNLGAMGAAVWAFKDYAVGVFLLAPGVSGYLAALLVHQVSNDARARWAVLAAMTSYLLSMVFVVAFAGEGAACLVMASPLLGGSALVGGAVGHLVGSTARPGGLAVPGASALVMLPLSLAAEHLTPVGDATPAPVESVVEVDAPPEVVWRRVLSFPPLDPPTELPFRMGIAAPLSASIEGTGVGAVRRCEFTTGTFVEPIDTWNEGRELAFSVASQPDPMREQTLHAGPRPPHLDGYLRSTRGQFVLEPLPGGRTRLVGRTWYEVHMAPVGYWRFVSDRIIHAIHLRVLHHVAKLAEADARPRAKP